VGNLRRNSLSCQADVLCEDKMAVHEKFIVESANNGIGDNLVRYAAITLSVSCMMFAIKLTYIAHPTSRTALIYFSCSLSNRKHSTSPWVYCKAPPPSTMTSSLLSWIECFKDIVRQWFNDRVHFRPIAQVVALDAVELLYHFVCYCFELEC
jgi:hypothetical protein